MTQSKHPTGIRRTPQGWQAYVHLRSGYRSKRFAPDATLTSMKAWRQEQRIREKLGAALPAPDSTLREDIRHYLEQIRTMPTLRYRRDDLALWLNVFGPDRDRRTITAGEIRAQLETWRAAGYAASTCNHRRTALMHLFTVLDGKSAPNPVRDVPRYTEELGPPRALSQAAIAAVLRELPTSQTRARLELMAYTGWPPAQIMRLRPEDIDWNRAVFVQARRKGRGAAGAWLPLLPAAWRALKAFKRLGCWGAYSTSSARRSFRLAAQKAAASRRTPKAIRAELADVTPYQLRHSFLTLVAGITRDDRAVKVLAQHADIRQTHRYTEATADPRAVAALAAVAGSNRAATVPRSQNQQKQA
jgi:integrase